MIAVTAALPARPITITAPAAPSSTPPSTPTAAAAAAGWPTVWPPAMCGGMGSRSPALVNDLDLKLIGPDGAVYYPYSLAGTSNPAALATPHGPNTVDTAAQELV